MDHVDLLRKRLLLALVLALAIYLVGPGLVPATGIGSLFHRLLAHPVLVLGLGAAATAGILLTRRGHGAWALSLGLGALLVAAGFAALRVAGRHPDHRLTSPAAYAQAARLLLGDVILAADYRPRSTLVVANHTVPRAKHRAIDMHFHLGSLDSTVTADRLVAAMDSVGIESVVSLDFSPNTWDVFLRDFVSRYPDRFIDFATLQLWQMNAPNFVANQTAWLEQAIELGARGLKVWKPLGLGYRDSTKTLVHIDDPRFDFVWTLAGRVGMPVLMHIADPEAFFDPIDRYNERYIELNEHPEWSFYGPRFPPFDSLMAQRERLLRKHPNTVFIGAHLGNNASDLRYAGHLLDAYPNYYVDISSRLSELGRQPRTAREFFVRYQDRIVFATDGGFALDRPNWPIEKFYQTHFRFLETDDEYFDYPLAEITKQGSWKIYGLNLPDTVLGKIYAGNARKLIPAPDSVRARLRALRATRPAASPTASPPASSDAELACAGRPYRWAGAGAARPTALGEDSVEVGRADFAGDSVTVTNYSFRPGRYREIVANGQIRNGSASTIELRGFRAEYLSSAGKVVGASTCRVRMGYEHCGLASTNIRLPGYVAFSADTLPIAPPVARFDSARVFWTYCTRR